MYFASFKSYLRMLAYFWQQHDSERNGGFTQASTVIKPMIYYIPIFGTLKDLHMNYYSLSGNRTLAPQDYEEDIPGVGLVVIASDTSQHRPNHLTGPPAEVFNTTVSNALE